MSEEQFVFNPSYLAQSCDQSQYENYEKMIIKNIDVFDKLVGDIQLMLAEKKRVDPAVLNTKLATVLDRISELEEMQNKLLKQNYREAHRTARSDFWDATENQLRNWCKSVKDFTIYYETKKLLPKWIRITEYLNLQSEKQYFIDDFNKKMHNYENLIHDESKFEWLLEKLQESEKLIQSVKDIRDKQLNYMIISRKASFETENTETVEDMQNSVDSIRKAVNKRQEERNSIPRSPIRTPRLSHPSSVRRSEASAASSKAEKMESERLKAKMLREKEIEQKKIDNELKLQARQREIQQQQQQMEAEKRRIEDEQRQLQDEIEREKREMEAELQKQLLDAEAEDAIRQIDINQARANGSRAQSSNASVRSVLSLPDQSQNQVNTWLNNNPGVSQQQPPAINSSSQHSMTTPAVAGASNSFGLFSGVTQSVNKPVQTFSTMKQSNFGSSNANTNQIPSHRSSFPNTNNQQTNFAGQRSRDRSPVQPRTGFYNTPSVTFDPNVFYS